MEMRVNDRQGEKTPQPTRLSSFLFFCLTLCQSNRKEKQICETEVS